MYKVQPETIQQSQQDYINKYYTVWNREQQDIIINNVQCIYEQTN